MILTCPNCITRFSLPARALAPYGKKVKCSECAEEWFARPNEEELQGDEAHHEEDIPDAVKPVQGGSGTGLLVEDTPDREQSKFANAMGYAAAALIFAGGIFGLIAQKDTLVAHYPPIISLYELLGTEVSAPGEGLVFDRITAQIISDNDIIVQGHVLNLTSEPIQPLALKISLRAPDKRVVHSAVIAPPEKPLAGEDSIPFKTIYSGEVLSADHVTVEFVLDDGTPSTAAAAATSAPMTHGSGEGHKNTETDHSVDHGASHDGEHH